MPYSGNGAVGREIGNVAEFHGLQKETVSAVVEILRGYMVGLLDDFDGELFGGGEDGRIRSDAIAFDVSCFDFISDGAGSDVSESEVGRCLGAGSYGKDEGGWRIGKK